MPLAEQLKKLVPALPRCSDSIDFVVEELTEFVDAYVNVRTSRWLPTSKQQVDRPPEFTWRRTFTQLWCTKMHGFYDDEVHGSCGAERTTQSWQRQHQQVHLY